MRGACDRGAGRAGSGRRASAAARLGARRAARGAWCEAPERRRRGTPPSSRPSSRGRHARGGGLHVAALGDERRPHRCAARARRRCRRRRTRAGERSGGLPGGRGRRRAGVPGRWRRGWRPRPRRGGQAAPPLGAQGARGVRGLQVSIQGHGVRCHVLQGAPAHSVRLDEICAGPRWGAREPAGLGREAGRLQPRTNARTADYRACAPPSAST